MMTMGKAKKDLKKIASPGGTASAVALISDVMAMKTTTEISFSAMPRAGFIVRF